MKTVSPEHWPEGPSGSTLFQPKGSENQNRRMRDRSELVEAWHEEQAKKSKKREKEANKRPRVEERSEDSDNEQDSDDEQDQDELTE